MIFGEKGVRIDRIKLVTYSASDISRLNNTQIQNIIDYMNNWVHVILKTVTNGNDQGYVTLKTKQNKAEVNTSANVLSAFQSNPTYDHAYFYNKALDQYSNLYREFSSENFDYYGITDEKLCPLCKLKHDDEESIEGRYKAGSYFIKCEQREIEIVT